MSNRANNTHEERVRKNMTTNITKYKAEQILELSGSYTEKALNKAYRDKVMTCHPDAGGNGEEMVQVNAAKAYLLTFFIDDSNRVIECSQTDLGEDEPLHQQVEYQKAQKAAQDMMNEFYAEAYKRSGADKDAPFYNEDYTAKPQNEWSEQDWEAFKEFRPPRAYDDLEFMTERADFWLGNACALSTAGNIDVSEWNRRDWVFYWLTNARNPRNDDQVYTRFKADALYGPYAERARARKMRNYSKIYNIYQNRGERFVTVYSCVDASSVAKMGWRWNVGIPFAYAACEDYESWRKMNLEAMKGSSLAKEAGDGKYPAEIDGWSGSEFDQYNTEQDKKFIYDDDVAYEKLKEKDREKRKAKANKKKNKSATSEWEETLNKASTATYRNMGYDANLFERAYGKGKAFYNRNKIPNAPMWYNALSALLNHIPWRTLFWCAVVAYAFMAAYSDTSSIEVIFKALLGVVCAIINQTGFFTNMIRGPIRWLLDAALKIWAKATNTEIDWVAARKVES